MLDRRQQDHTLNRDELVTYRYSVVLVEVQSGVADLFTDTAAILNKFDLRSIIGCPGGMSTFPLYFRALFGTFFVKVFLE